MMTIDVETLRTWLEEGRPVTVLPDWRALGLPVESGTGAQA